MIKKIIMLYKRFFWTFEKQARHAGVVLGNNNFIASHFWTTEAYLITVGSNCQITAGVKMFTHGGGAAVRKIFPDFESSIHSFKEYLKDKYKKENQIPWHLKTKVTNYNMVMKLLVDFYL